MDKESIIHILQRGCESDNEKIKNLLKSTAIMIESLLPPDEDEDSPVLKANKIFAEFVQAKYRNVIATSLSKKEKKDRSEIFLRITPNDKGGYNTRALTLSKEKCYEFTTNPKNKGIDVYTFPKGASKTFKWGLNVIASNDLLEKLVSVYGEPSMRGSDEPDVDTPKKGEIVFEKKMGIYYDKKHGWIMEPDTQFVYARFYAGGVRALSMKHVESIEECGYKLWHKQLKKRRPESLPTETEIKQLAKKSRLYHNRQKAEESGEDKVAEEASEKEEKTQVENEAEETSEKEVEEETPEKEVEEEEPEKEVEDEVEEEPEEEESEE